MKKEPIKILLLEDNPGDVRLLREFLQEDNLVRVELDHVEKLKTGLTRLTQRKPDVILLDLGLPDSQGLETFTRVYAQAPDVPIVVLTGLNDSEQAVKAVKAGAQDYLVKGEVSGGVLVRAIRYAIERKQVEEALYQSNAFNTMLLQTSPLGMDIVDEDGKFLFLSPAMQKAVGHNALGERCWDLYKDDKQQCRDCPLKREVEVGITNIIETASVLGGRIFEISHTGMFFQGQKAILEVFHDITERKQAENMIEARLRLVEFAAKYSLGELLQKTLDEVCVITNSPIGFYHFVESDQKTLSLQAWSTRTLEEYCKSDGKGLHYGVDEAGVWVDCIHQRKPVIHNDYASLPASRRRGLPEGHAALMREMVVPIFREGLIVAILGVGNKTKEYTEKDVNMVAYFADVAWEIAERKQAEEEVRHRLSELEVLYESSLAIGQLLQPKEIGQKIIEILSERLHWHHSTLRYYHPESETLELLAFQQMGLENEAERLAAEERFGTLITPAGQGFNGWVIQHGLPVYCSDVSKDSRYLEVEPGICSGVYVPLKVGERTIGCLSVESQQVDAFTETDEWLITTLASQAASALENARLFEETMQRLEKLQSLRTIDNAISGNVEITSILDVILEQVNSQLGSDAAVILLFNPLDQVLEYANGCGFRTQALQHTRLPLGEGYAGTAALGRKMIHISDLRARKTDFLRSPTFSQEGFVSYFGIPLIAKGMTKGVLEIFFRIPFKQTTEWLSFFETLAGQTAIAIENASLYKGLQLSNTELMQAYDATIEGWSHALDLRDKETEGHTQRVTRITMDLGRAMGINEAELVHMRRGALLHDIGKMGVPDSILLKPDSLSSEEWVIMRKHPTFAYEMLLPIAYLKPALDIPYCHHEKWDGTGYPRGLKEEHIPLAARLFAVVDVWDALTSDRPYRKAWTHEKSIRYIGEQSGSHFDPEVVNVFLNKIAYEIV